MESSEREQVIKQLKKKIIDTIDAELTAESFIDDDGTVATYMKGTDYAKKPDTGGNYDKKDHYEKD